MKLSVAILAVVLIITMCKVIIEREDKPEKKPKYTAVVKQSNGGSVTLELESYYFAPDGTVRLRTNDGITCIAEVKDVTIIEWGAE